MWLSKEIHYELLYFHRKTIFNLGLKLEEYWEEIRYKRKTENPEYGTEAVEDTMFALFFF